MPLNIEEKQEIIDAIDHNLKDLVRKYNKINTKFNNFKTNWNLTPNPLETDLSKLSDAQLQIRFRTIRKLKAEIENVTGNLTHELTTIDTEIIKRRDALL